MNDASHQTPHQALATRLRHLMDALPAHYATLLGAPEFERGQTALTVLRAPGRIDAAVADLGSDEAAWLVAKLDLHWQRIAPRITEPSVRLVSPDVAWFAGPEVTLALHASVEGLADGWEVIWPDNALPDPNPERAQLAIIPGEQRQIELSIRVIGYPLATPCQDASNQRTILTCKQAVMLCRAKCWITQDRKSLVVRDSQDLPASGLSVEIGQQSVTLDAHGRAIFDTPLSAQVAPLLDGIQIPVESE